MSSLEVEAASGNSVRREDVPNGILCSSPSGETPLPRPPVLRPGRPASRPVLLAAWRQGARFDGWSEYFRPEIWTAAFAATGVDPDFYTVRERNLDEALPWSHIQCGASAEWLAAEWRRALAGEFTADCRHGQCSGCGVCQTLDAAVVDWRE